MKLVHKQFDKNGDGTVTLVPETMEDMWHCYNLISVGDRLKASTMRKIQTESSTGTVDNQRIRTVLTLKVESIDYDPHFGLLRIKGRTDEENKFVRLGAYHTIDLELNIKFTLEKAEWDAIAIERIETACDPVKSSDVAAVIMQEGSARICLLTETMTITRQRVEVSIPKKRLGETSQYQKAVTKFYDQILQAILNPNNINFEVVKCIILASPGFVKDQFYEYMMDQATKRDLKILFDNKPKFLLVHSSSGHKQALLQILKDPAVLTRLTNTKAAKNIKALDAFYKTMTDDPSKAFYGYKHVQAAADKAAIQTLLISDQLFRAREPATRKKYVDLVESVKEMGGEVNIFSSAHASGEQLGQLTGIAAILRFPMDEIDEDGEDEEMNEEFENNNRSSDDE